jgi:hypothetical protein
MINTIRVSILLVVLLGLTTFVSAQTRSTAVPVTSGPCTVKQFEGSDAGGVQIVAGYEPLFQSEKDLASSPFPAGATVALDANGNPVFGCTADNGLWLEVLSQSATGTQVATVMNKPANQSWRLAFSSQFAHNGPFPNLGSNGPLQLGTVFNKATAFLAQGNRIVMLGQFGVLNKPIWRAYDITADHVGLYDFGKQRTDSIPQSCVTASNLWFSVDVGNFQQVFSVDPTGSLTLAATSNTGGITLTCTTSGANLAIPNNGGKTASSTPLSDLRIAARK